MNPNLVFLTSTEVMRLLGYKNRGGFWSAVQRLAIPHIRINQRKILFPERALMAWLERRAVGRVDLSK
jgi:hypothetical protein